MVTIHISSKLYFYKFDNKCGRKRLTVLQNFIAYNLEMHAVSKKLLKNVVKGISQSIGCFYK